MPGDAQPLSLNRTVADVLKRVQRLERAGATASGGTRGYIEASYGGGSIATGATLNLTGSWTVANSSGDPGVTLSAGDLTFAAGLYLVNVTITMGVGGGTTPYLFGFSNLILGNPQFPYYGVTGLPPVSITGLYANPGSSADGPSMTYYAGPTSPVTVNSVNYYIVRLFDPA